MRGPTSRALTHEELRELNRTVKSSTGRRLLWEIYDLRRVVVKADLLALRVRQISIDDGAIAQIAAEELRKILSNLPWLEEERRDRIGRR